MRKIVSLCFLVGVALTMAQVAAPSSFVWFDQVTSPLKLSESQMLEVATRLHQGLKGKTPLEQLMRGMPEDPSPRVVFLTIGDDQWPSRTYFGTGFSFCDALGKAVSILRSNEAGRVEGVVKQATSIIEDAKREHRKAPKDWLDRRNAPGEWRWLKIQPVQAAKRYPTFSFGRSNFSFSALVGFAFGPRMGFAFTPDQITGRYLLTQKNFMSKKQIGNIIAESYNFDALNTWLALSNVEQEQGICLFEVDTYYSDGVAASRMFRCHSMPFVPNAAQCADAALRGARALSQRVATKSGEFKQPFPDWQQPRQDVESRDDICELAIALRRAAARSKDPVLAAAAGHVLIAVRNNIIAIGERKQFQAIVEVEAVAADSSRQARTLAVLRENALALLALLADEGAVETDKESRERCKALAGFIASMGRGDGTYHSAQVVPSGQMLEAQSSDFEGRCVDHALAAVALHRAGSLLGVPEWREQSLATVAQLVKELSARDLKNATVDPWVVEALTLRPKVSREHARLLSRVGASLIMSKTQAPPAADLAGAPQALPCYTSSARATWALAVLAGFFRRLQPAYAEALMAEAAVMVSFQLQGQLDVPTSSCMARPRFYVDFFRDYPDDFRFTLYGNVSQVMSLLAVSDVLGKQFKGEFPDIQTARDQLNLARRFADLHPAYLTAGIISSGKGVSEEARSSIGTLQGGTESKMSQAETEKFFKRAGKGRKK